MGAAGETTTPPATSKAAKTSTTPPAVPATTPSAPAQEHQAGALGYNEWAAAFQAYYQAGAQQPPPGGFPHPYMWAGMPPYGGPHPSYGAMYPPGAMYAHPMYGQYGAPSSEAMAGGEQAEVKPEPKPVESGKQTPLKRSKGSRGSLQLMKVSESGGKRNGVSHSSNGDDSVNETGSDGSTEGSREENVQNLLPKRRFELMAIEPVAAGGYMPPPGGVSGAPAVGTPGPAGSLDMSLDYWNAGKVAKQIAGSPSTNAPPAELWLQDEREVKRQRRKQANRESARRSRLRKQAECEELGTRVDTLTVENMALRTELTRVTEECKRLQVEVSTLLQQLRSKPSLERAAPVSAATAPSAAGQKEVSGDTEMEESQNHGNGNVQSKDDKPSGRKTGDEQTAAA